jgi:hypothetical protein
MKKLPTASAVLAIASSVTMLCTSTGAPNGPGTQQTMGTTVAILKAGYATSGGNTMTVTIPGHVKCAGTSSIDIADSTKSGPFGLVGTDSMELALTILMAGVSAIPTVDSATIASFSSILSNSFIAGRQMNGVFMRVGTGSGLPGSWAFVGVALDPLVESVINSNADLKAQVDSTIGVLAGTSADRILYLQVLADSIAVYVDKGWYGQQMVLAPADTAHNGISVTSQNASSWMVIGRSSHDTVRAAISDLGDVGFTSNNGLWPAYTYHLMTTGCPDGQLPDWWNQLLTANPP